MCIFCECKIWLVHAGGFAWRQFPKPYRGSNTAKLLNLEYHSLGAYYPDAPDLQEVMTSALTSIFDDALRSKKDADKAEASLVKAPSDIETRAQLIHYYFNQECKSGNSSFTEQRFPHIAWFIENAPDLQFCGTRPFYIKQQNAHWEKCKELWQLAINRATDERRRINACMFVSAQDQSLGIEWLNSLFPADSMNIWALSLRDLLCHTKTSYQSLVEGERRKTWVNDDQSRAASLAEFKTKKDWETFAMRDCGSFDNVELNSVSREITDLESASNLARQSILRIQSNSILGFDPEAISLRFIVASWIIKHLPSSKLAVSPIFMSPFESPGRYTICDVESLESMECLFQYLIELWTLQLRSFPKEKKIAKNAANFAKGCRPFFPKILKQLDEELR